MTLLIFYPTLATFWRPGKLHHLALYDLNKTKKLCKWAYLIRSRISTTTGSSKCEQGGINVVCPQFSWPSIIMVRNSGTTQKRFLKMSIGLGDVKQIQ